MILTLPHKPRKKQIELYAMKNRFVVAVVGRQFGKSTIAQLRLTKHLMTVSDANAYWICPTYAQARIQFDRYTKYYKDFIKDVNKTRLEITALNDSKVSFRGSDNADALRGDTLSHAVLDECATMRSEVWREIVQPMLLVKKGSADFLSTPKGRNWFFEIASYAKKSFGRINPEGFQIVSHAPFIIAKVFVFAGRINPEGFQIVSP